MKRIKEGSTWAGFAALAQMLANVLPQYAIPLHVVTAAAGAIAAALPDAGAEK